MAKDLRAAFIAAEHGDFDTMETVVRAYGGRDRNTRDAARELALAYAIACGSATASDRLAAVASEGNIFLAYWNLASAYVDGKHGLVFEPVRVRWLLERARPHIHAMNGGKLLVSSRVKTLAKRADVCAIYDDVFGVAYSRFVRVADRAPEKSPTTKNPKKPTNTKRRR